MSEETIEFTKDIENSIKMRPSQRAILKVIEKSISTGDMDSAVELTEKLGRGLKGKDREKFQKVVKRISKIKPQIKTVTSTPVSTVSETPDYTKELIEEVNKNKNVSDRIETEGEVVEIGEDKQKQLTVEEITDDFTDYNSLGVDLVPPNEKTQINVQDAEVHFDGYKISDENEEYDSLGVDLVPPSEKGKVSDLLDQVKKEVDSFPGTGPMPEPLLIEPDSHITDDDINRIIESSGDDSMLVIEDEGKEKGAGENQIKIDEKPISDPIIQPIIQAQTIASQGNIVEQPSIEGLSSVSTPGKIQFEYAPIPGLPSEDSQTTLPSESSETSSQQTAPQQTGDNALANALKDALSNAISDAVGSFKDDNKDLFDDVERPRIEQPKITMPEIEEEEDEGKPWMREAKETEFEVHSFNEDAVDESVGKYEVYDDEETDKFKDVNKELFDNIEKEPKTFKDEVKQAYTDEDNIKVEHNRTNDGSQEIIFYNMDEKEKKKKPPKKPPKRVRLSFSFRNLFNNKTYVKYKDILNRAAILVAEKRLDEALDYYYTIRDQNIPNVFKMMVQQNIDDIEETIMRTFQYSDTIVKVKDSGKAIRLRDINEFERQIEEKRKEELSQKKDEVFYNEE